MASGVGRGPETESVSSEKTLIAASSSSRARRPESAPQRRCTSQGRGSTSSRAFGVRRTVRRCRRRPRPDADAADHRRHGRGHDLGRRRGGDGHRRRPWPGRPRQQRRRRQAGAPRVPADGRLPNAAGGQPVRAGRHDPGVPAAHPTAAAAGSSTSRLSGMTRLTTPLDKRVSGQVPVRLG